MSFLLLALVTIGANAQAQQRKNQPNGSGDRRAETLARSLQLDETAKAWFVPLYKEYQDTLKAVKPSQRTDKLPKAQTEEECGQQIEKMFEAAEKEVALKRAYFARFKEKLSNKQILQIFSPQRPSRQGRPGMQGGERRSGRFFGEPADMGE